MNFKYLGTVFMGKFVGARLSSHQKNLPGSGLTKAANHCSSDMMFLSGFMKNLLGLKVNNGKINTHFHNKI
jgi:hypothetical protein